jgi:hypothetical protein
MRQYGVAAVPILDNGDELLFVYGTLMNPAERVLLLGRPIDASPGRIPGYARGRKRHYFVAKQADAVTDGAILEGLSARELAILDQYRRGAGAIHARADRSARRRRAQNRMLDLPADELGEGLIAHVRSRRGKPVFTEQEVEDDSEEPPENQQPHPHGVAASCHFTSAGGGLGCSPRFRPNLSIRYCRVR